MQRRDVATVPSDLVAVAPGSQPLRNPKHERFVTLRATLRPKVEAPVRRPSFGGLFGGTVRKSGWRDQLAYSPIVTAVRVCLSFLQFGSSQAARAVGHDVTACRPGAGRVRPRLGRGLSHHPRCGARVTEFAKSRFGETVIMAKIGAAMFACNAVDSSFTDGWRCKLASIFKIGEDFLLGLVTFGTYQSTPYPRQGAHHGTSRQTGNRNRCGHGRPFGLARLGRSL